MKPIIGIIVFILALLFGVIWLGSLKPPESKEHFSVNCYDNSCSVMYIPKFGDHSTIKEHLSPCEAQKLVEELNAKVEDKK